MKDELEFEIQQGKYKWEAPVLISLDKSKTESGFVEGFAEGETYSGTMNS